MNIRYNEFVIGVAVTLAIFIVIAGIMWLERSNFLEKGIVLNLVVDNAEGISVGDEVRYKGLVVGSVHSASIDREGIVLGLKIKAGVQIPRDSRFVIKEVSLLGEKAVEIIPGQSSQFLQNGAVIHGQTTHGLLDVLGKSKPITQRLTRILSHVDSLTDPHASVNVHTMLAQLTEAIVQINTVLAQNSRDIQQTIQNLNAITTTSKGPVDSILHNLSRKSNQLAQTIDRANRVSAKLDSMLTRIQSGNGTAGKLFRDDSLYKNLNTAIIHLDSLIQDIHKNPEKFLKIEVF